MKTRALLAGCLAGMATMLVLPSVLYRTEAVVGIGTEATPLRDAMTDAAVTAAASKPVILQAAESLVGTDVAAPSPGWLDRISVTLGMDRAESRGARLAETIKTAIDARGTAPGIVKIAAEAPDAGHAAHIATAVAEALVAQQDRESFDLVRQRDAQGEQERESLQAAVLAARRRFTALGGTDVDPAQAVAAAAAQTATAQARLDVVRSIVASGNPPVSDRHDLPANVAALQTAYLDLSQQLATARETMGDRHTTVISLQQGVKRAGANLAAEWKRLTKVADVELSAAREREAAARKTQIPTDPAKRAALDDAHRMLMIAEDGLGQAMRLRRERPSDVHAYRVIAVAPVPNASVGFSLTMRLMLAALAGVAAYALMRALRDRSFDLAGLVSSTDAVPVPVPVSASAPRMRATRDERHEPAFFEPEDAPVPAQQPLAQARPEPAQAPHAHQDPRASYEPRAPHVSRSVPRPASSARPVERVAPRPQPRPARPMPRDPDADGDDLLQDAMADLLPELAQIVSQSDLPVVMVAANETGAATAPVALALSVAAAEAGHRVLLVESAGPRAALAACVATDAEPALIDIFGSLRIALPAAAQDGRVFIAPAFQHGDQLAAGLARADDIAFVDDLPDVFDLIVIDGGEAAQGHGLADVSDAFLRVATYPSAREDERFLARLGAPQRAFLGTIAASAFVPKQDVERPRIVPAPRPETPPASRISRPLVRLNVAVRRKVGARP